jgi:hypothetical protein
MCDIVCIGRGPEVDLGGVGLVTDQARWIQDEVPWKPRPRALEARSRSYEPAAEHRESVLGLGRLDSDSDGWTRTRMAGLGLGWLDSDSDGW